MQVSWIVIGWSAPFLHLVLLLTFPERFTLGWVHAPTPLSKYMSLYYAWITEKTRVGGKMKVVLWDLGARKNGNGRIGREMIGMGCGL